MSTKIHYLNFETGKKHWTRGAFVRWVWDKRIRNFRAMIQREKSVLYIPRYLITGSSRVELPYPPRICDRCDIQEDETEEIYICEACGGDVCWTCSEEHPSGRICEICTDAPIQEETTHPVQWTD